MTSHWGVITVVAWGLLVWLPLTSAGATPSAWWVSSARQTCEALGVLGVLAVAIILTESGGQPYAIKVNQGEGISVFLATYDAGVRAVALAVQATPNIDLGMMQVNYATWGARLGVTPAQLLHPAVNLWAGCTVLRQALAAGGPPWQQIGRYHSPTPARQRVYARKVAAWLAALTQ